MHRTFGVLVSFALFALPGVAFAGVVRPGQALLGASIADPVVGEGPCTIAGSTIDGNVIGALGGNLLVSDSTINGSLQNDGSRRVRVKRSDVNGDIQLTGLTSLK